jgi:adenosylhomocysteine nucleosidase
LGDVGRILAVTGTKREASVLRGLGVDVIAVGGSVAALEGALANARAPFAGMISFGMAGALNPDLGLGDWVIGTGLAGGADCEASWAKSLALHLPKAKLGPIYADGRLISDPAEKHAISQRTGALAADMESHLVAQAAAKAGVFFAVLRCISDEADFALPPAIAVAMKPDGGLALGAVLASIMRNPLQIPDLVKISLCFNRAFLDMQTGVKLLGPRLAFDQR